MQTNDPLHGVKLAQILIDLQTKYTWKEMGDKLGIKCFLNNPTQKSCLKFLRQTPWARSRVEIMYLKTFCSKHPETTKLIRSILATQDKKQQTPAPKAEKKPSVIKSNDGFQWAKINNK
ncbi:VF530 family DNA-binding protein [Psychromonas sp. KJ10-2]|uniref:VF530 family protein n=1 Tax=Psychromonas sp. KJ10-2 TaxID=3391822 RepID=UPI0039B4F6B2